MSDVSTSSVQDVIHTLDTIAPPYLALGNDPRGLLVGDPQAPVSEIVVALDVTPEVARTASVRGAQMIVAHHPLIYNPLRTVRTDEPHPGGVVLHCIRHDIAVACAHTNWDVAPGGVNDVLAHLVGITEPRPLRTTWREPLVKIAVFVPKEERDDVLDAMAAAGAGAIGDYDRCAFWTPGTGTFRPLPGAAPYIGTVGAAEIVPEERLEMIVPQSRSQAVVSAMKAAHPYEEVAYDVYTLSNSASEQGIGRIGKLTEPLSAADFLERVKSALNFPEVRMVGPRDRRIEKVAVGGGACAEMVPDAIAQGADAMVTSDIRHHEFVDAAARGFVLLDAGHAATETPGARELANRLAQSLSPDVRVTFLSADGAEESYDQRS